MVQLLSWVKHEPTDFIVVFGLDGSGKTTFLYKYPALNRRGNAACLGLICMVRAIPDDHHCHGHAHARNELHRTLRDYADAFGNAPLLVLGTMIDLPRAVSKEELISVLDLDLIQERQWHVEMVSIKNESRKLRELPWFQWIQGAMKQISSNP